MLKAAITLLLLVLPLEQPGQGKIVPPLGRTMHAWKLAFVRKGAIWVSNGDGSDQRRIILDADGPCWSPDRKQVAFARRGEVWTALADGSRQHRLTYRWNLPGQVLDLARGYSGGRDVDISWGGADNLLDFSHWESFKLARAGSNSFKTLHSCSVYELPAKSPTRDELDIRYDMFDDGAGFHASINAHPAWAADGKRLAFVRNGDIWIAGRAERLGDPSWPWTHRTSGAWGWEVTRLAATAGYDAPTYRASRENEYVTHLSWSPDGKRLVYCSRRINGTGTCAIYMLRLSDSGGGISAKTDSCDLDAGEDPCFSPDGSFVAYSSSYNQYGRSRILAQSTNGKTVMALIEDGEEPAW